METGRAKSPGSIGILWRYGLFAVELIRGLEVNVLKGLFDCMPWDICFEGVKKGAPAKRGGLGVALATHNELGMVLLGNGEPGMVPLGNGEPGIAPLPSPGIGPVKKLCNPPWL